MLKILLESTSSLGGVGVHLGREKLPDVGFVGALERAGGGDDREGDDASEAY